MRLWKLLTCAGIVVIAGGMRPARGQAPLPVVPGLPPIGPGAVVRRVVMKDSQSAELFRTRLDTLKASGLFRDTVPGPDPKKPLPIEISFLTSGNYLLVVGSREWVDSNIEAVRLMGYLFERPRAHLQLSLRVVQLTGPANQDVIQMSETVRALVDAQRDEVVRAFADLDDYLTARAKQRQGAQLAVYESARELFPTLGTGARPLTVPEILLLLMMDRSAPAPGLVSGGRMGDQYEQALLMLPRALSLAIHDPQREDASIGPSIKQEIADWKVAVGAARDWCGHYAGQLKGKEGLSVATFREVLHGPDCALPSWVGRRLLRSLEMTERLYPNLVRKHTEQSLRELERRFGVALERAEALEKELIPGSAPPEKKSEKKDRDKDRDAPPATVRLGRPVVALKSLADELIPAPLALFESVANAADNSAPTPEQLVDMIKQYAVERRKLEQRLYREDTRVTSDVNYARLQSLEATLNLWLRRVSEAMARSLEQQFYSRYVGQLRVLANKELGRNSSRTLLQGTAIDAVPDVARDILLSDTGVNIFVSNSISLQFAPDTTNTVSAQVQAQLPSKQGLLERVQQANAAATALSALNASFGINGEGIVKALLAGGQAVPIQGGITLSANPSIGFDASTVSLSITANQTLQPNTDKVADRVTNHSINNATVTALSYEPMVLSTLASNISYYEETGGIPILRKAPYLKDILKDIPLAPFKQVKRQKGVYQSSVIILEPVVIPTIEDLIRFHGGWREVPGIEDATPAAAMGTMPAAAPAAMPATPMQATAPK
jgi:hypothetical protein